MANKRWWSGSLGVWENVFANRKGRGSVFLTAARAAAEEERANAENSSRARTLWRRPRRGSQRIEPPSCPPYCAVRSLAGDQRAVLGGNNGAGSQSGKKTGRGEDLLPLLMKLIAAAQL